MGGSPEPDTSQTVKDSEWSWHTQAGCAQELSWWCCDGDAKEEPMQPGQADLMPSGWSQHGTNKGVRSAKHLAEEGVPQCHDTTALLGSRGCVTSLCHQCPVVSEGDYLSHIVCTESLVVPRAH